MTSFSPFDGRLLAEGLDYFDGPRLACPERAADGPLPAGENRQPVVGRTERPRAPATRLRPRAAGSAA